MRLALYQPDIPQNLGAAIRIAACFDVPLDIIEPCGFPLTDKALKRAALDYQAATTRHASWAAFAADPARRAGRLVLLTTGRRRGATDFAFAKGDTLLMGSESAGVPAQVHQAVFGARADTDRRAFTQCRGQRGDRSVRSGPAERNAAGLGGFRAGHAGDQIQDFKRRLNHAAAIGVAPHRRRSGPCPG